MKWFLILCLGISLQAGELESRLLQDLEAGKEPALTPIEMIMVAGGAENDTELKEQVGVYETYIQSIAGAGKSGSAKKRVKSLVRKLKPKMATKNPESFRVLDLIETKTYSPITATLLLADLAERAGVKPKDLYHAGEAFDAFFTTDQGFTKKQLLSAVFACRGTFLPETASDDATRALRISTLLAPKSSFGNNRLDILLYNRTYQMFQVKAIEDGAALAAAAAERYPNRPEFQPLTYNYGIVLFQNAESSGTFKTAIELGASLAPYTGKNQADFEKALNTTRYNYAVKLAQDKELQAAIHVAEKIDKPADQVSHRNLLISCYEQLIEARSQKGDQDGSQALMARLKELHPRRAEQLEIRLKQLALKQLDDQGNLDEALRLAEQNLGTEVDRSNYHSVLNRMVQKKTQADQYDDALALLNRVPEAVRNAESVNELRQYVYSSWLNGIPQEATNRQLSVFRKLFSDKQLKLSGGDRANYQDAYGNALYKQIETLIADRDFTKADTKSKQALRVLPNHALLKDQRKLVDTILKRIGQ